MDAAPKPTIAIPRLETSRLTLSAHRLEDFADCVALWSDPFVTRFIGGRPSTRDETWARMLRYLGHWALLGYGYWVVREKSTGRFIGEVGFSDFKRELEPSLSGAPEAGWALLPEVHGKGYATEAMLAALSWASMRMSAARTICMIDVDNSASFRVAAKLGYRELLRISYRSLPTVILARPRA